MSPFTYTIPRNAVRDYEIVQRMNAAQVNHHSPRGIGRVISTLVLIAVLGTLGYLFLWALDAQEGIDHAKWQSRCERHNLPAGYCAEIITAEGK